MQALRENSQLVIRVEEMQKSMEKLSKYDRDRVRFDCLRLWHHADSGWRRHTAWGIPICRQATCEILTMGKQVFGKLTSHIAKGFVDPPVDMRTARLQSQNPADQEAVLAAKTMLTWIYEHLAEPLAESGDLKPKRIGMLLQGGAEMAAAGVVGPDEARFLAPHTSLQELYDCSSSMVPLESGAPSYSTFVRVFHSDYQQILKFRHETQHAKCNDCERYKQLRRISHAPSDIKQINDEQKEHLGAMMMDREMYTKLCHLAREGKILSLDIDSMDCAKWRVPRNLASTKQFEALWRPECTFTCVLTQGFHENFFIMEQDLVKDSNLMMTLLSRSMQRALEELHAKGKPCPPIIHIHSDNAASETKNQHVMKWASHLIKSGLCDCICFTQFRVGHSHGVAMSVSPESGPFLPRQRCWKRLGNLQKRFKQSSSPVATAL